MAIAENARPSIALTHFDIYESLVADYAKSGPLAGAHWIVADQCNAIPPLAVDELATPQDNDLALLQYTSGSTRSPKGTMVLHKNLMHNAHLIRKAFRHDEISFSGVTWLPHYHDMGLMGGILQTMYLGAATVLMSPSAFIRHPLLWLKTISEYQGVSSGGPNFAYNHCTRRIPDSALTELDLSGWRIAFCGAEPINAKTLDAFAERFAAAGFRREAFTPCYGLAESTLAVTVGAYEQDLDILSVRAPRRWSVNGCCPPRLALSAARRWSAAVFHKAVWKSPLSMPKREIPKTSSGKLQRALVRQRVLEGRYHEVDNATSNTPSLYLPITPSFERLEARDTGKYRFDLERDICWDESDAGGDFFTDEVLAMAGIDTKSLTRIEGLAEDGNG